MIFICTVLLPKYDVKYLGLVISKELRNLYIRTYLILKTFNKCNTNKEITSDFTAPHVVVVISGHIVYLKHVIKS